MKKFIACIVFLALTLSSALGVSALTPENNITYEFSELHVEIVFEGDTSFSEAHQHRIAEILANDITPVESRAWCWLTGHNYVTDAVAKITHEARAYNPRCLQQMYEITTCSKCDYYAEELLNTSYIVCCPE